MEKEIKVGTIVVSLSGRDKGKHMLVTEIVSKDRVKVVDGKLRKLDLGKVKNIKHVKSTGYTHENIAKKINNKVLVFDKEINKIIRTYEESLKNKEEV